MRGKLQEALQISWKEAMKAELPDFQPYSAEPMPSTALCWQCKFGAITCFVMMHPHKREDIFTVDLLWSRHGFMNADLSIQRQSSEHIRLARLWDTTSQSDPWWEIVPIETWEEMNQRIDEGHFYREEVPIEECLPKVPMLVRDAVEKLKQFGIPYIMAKR